MKFPHPFADPELLAELEKCRQIASIRGVNVLRSRLAALNGKLNPDFTALNRATVSIIIPIYNAAATIERCLESIRIQTLSRLEIICVNDGSSDDSLSRIRNFYAPGINLKVIGGGENRGQGLRRNEGLKAARGEYVSFLDADDYFDDPYFLAKLYEQARSYDYDVVISSFKRLKNGLTTREKIKGGIMSGQLAAQKYLSREFATHAAWGKLFKRDIAQNAEFVDYGYSEDVLYVFRALLMADSVLVSGESGYVYNNENTSSWRPEELDQKHFYSSLRLLAEMLVEYLRLYRSGLSLEVDPFLRIWKNDHGGHIRSYLSLAKNHQTARHILAQFPFLEPFLLSLLGSEISFLTAWPAAKRPKDKGEAGVDAEYLKGLRRKFRQFVLSPVPAGGKREPLLIYSAHLDSGALERLAAQASLALKDRYEIIHVLDEPERGKLAHGGAISPARIFNPELLSHIARASFILDFTLPESGALNPFRTFVLRNFPEKYIGLVANGGRFMSQLESLKASLPEAGLSRLGALLCASRELKKKIASLYGEQTRLELLPPVLDAEWLKKQAGINVFGAYILYLGGAREYRQRGADIMLQAFARSALRGKCRILMPYEGELPEPLAHIIDYYDLKGEIINPRDGHDIFTLLRHARFLCVPHRFETPDFSILNSLACSTPVLASKAGLAQDLLRHKRNGYLCQPDSIRAASEGMEWLFEHGEELRPNCLPSVEGLDLDHYAESLRKILKTLNK